MTIANNIILSVIVPVYNTEMFLRECLNSLAKTEEINVEFIIINDGSTDGSRIICSDFCSHDYRFKLINKENGGLSSARNVGLSHAKGDFITFVDSDDFVEEGYIDAVLNYVSCNYGLFDLICLPRIYFPNIYLSKNFVFTSNEIVDLTEFIQSVLLMNNMDFSVCNKVFSSTLISGLEFECGRISEDMGFFINYIGRRPKVVKLNAPSYVYRDNLETTKC